MTRNEKIVLGSCFAGTWIALGVAWVNLLWLIPAYYNMAKVVIAFANMLGMNAEGGD